MGASVRPDPVAEYLKAKQQTPAPTTDPVADYLAARGKAPEGPGVLSRAASMVGSSLSHAVQHPLDTIESAVVAPIKSAFTAAVAPGVGESRPDARLSKGGNSSGRAIDTSPYDAEHGGVTSGERTAAGIQSVANAGTAAAVGPLASRIGKTGAMAATGAVEGAAYNPDDPGAGALAGAAIAPAVGNAVRGGAKAVDATRQVVGKGARIRGAPPLGETAVQMKKDATAASRENYGTAQAEAEANGGTSPALTEVLDHPRIKPFVDMVRASDTGIGATDAQLATEAYKLISRQRKGLQKKMAVEYDAKADLDARDLANAAKRLKAATSASSEKPALTMDVAPEVYDRAAKVTQPEREPLAGPVGTGPLSERTSPPNATLSQGLRNFRGNTENAVQGSDGPAFQLGRQPEVVQPGVRIESPGMRVQIAPAEAVPPVMPSFPSAVSEHARMQGNRSAFNTAADATKRVMQGTSVAANKLDTKSPAAFMEQILGMSPEDAQHALNGTLGRAKEQLPGLSLDPRSGFGVGRAAKRVGKIAPYIDALDRQAGRKAGRKGFIPPAVADFLRSLGEQGLRTVGITSVPNPDNRP